MKDFITLIKRLSFYFLVLPLLSCALYMGSDFNKKIPVLNPPLPSGICPEATPKTSSSVASSNPFLAQEFPLMIKKIKAQQGLSFVDEVVLWSLLQMNVRPDLVTPSSRLQFFIAAQKNEERNPRYFDYTARPQESSGPKVQKKSSCYPFLTALEELLKLYGSKLRLEDLSRLIGQHFPASIPIGDDFANFLEKHKDHLRHPVLEKYFFRAEHPLISGETIPRLNFPELIRRFRATKEDCHREQTLFPTRPEMEVLVSCNTDLNLYQNNGHQISPQVIPFHFFSLQRNQLFFLAAAGQILLEDKLPTVAQLQGYTPWENTLLLTARPSFQPAVFCLAQNLRSQTTLSMMAGDDRDPGQHLYHLVGQKIYLAQNAEEVDQTNRFGRHLFLERPARLLFESSRAREKQLDRFLSINFPLYHMDALGKIWIHTNFGRGAGKTAVDTRWPVTQHCY